ncbi:universal stress protein [Thalassospira alkalitolerans]|uniref:universal stress protein n=1 Tax=Thalassospira alkalitolerans TaxID=1293890 RepID=UPI000A1EC6FE|nr:universal stress protein [Thalassospira alkalitolerans]|tara:strand:+ start:2167 stop:3057 length:891 start_codon:yes stop_codon:yes gene_type:complete
MTAPILVATDFSDTAGLALMRGVQIAKSRKAGVHLLHVVEGDIWSGLAELIGLRDGNDHDRLHDQLIADLKELGRAVEKSSSIKVTTELRNGPVTREMIDCATATGARLQVMGGHGAGKLRDLATGSTAERLLRQATRPTLVVNYPVGEPYRKVLLPVDFSNWSEASLRTVRKLLPDAEIVLLHAVSLSYEPQLRHAGVTGAEIDYYREQEHKKAQAELAMLRADIGDPNNKISLRTINGDVASAILAVAGDENADLVAIGKHGRGMIEEWLLGSVTQHILASAPCDVLVCGNSAL